VLCPHCQAEQAEPAGRFCAACGLALPVARKAKPADEAPAFMACPSCGTKVRTRRCFACGSPVHWPEGATVPGDAEEGWTRRRHARPAPGGS
jgi:hypothetical protein